MADLTIQQKYQAVLSTGVGLDVLIDLLGYCGFGRKLNPQNIEEVVAYNLGQFILERCGAYQTNNMENLVQSMLGLRGRTPK